MLESNYIRILDGYMFQLTEQEKQLPLYLVSTGRITAPYPFYTMRSGRNDFQLLWTRSGMATLTCGNAQTELSPGSVTLIDCKDFHDYRTSSQQEPWVYDYIHFAGSAMSFFKPHLTGAAHSYMLASYANLENTFDILNKRQLRNDVQSRSQMFAMLAVLLNDLMISREPRLDEPPTYGEIIAPAVAYIHANYPSDVQVEELSRLCHLSKFYFIRTFHAAVGDSPYQYLIKVRISRSRALLSDTELPVGDIALRVGFKNYANFVAHFKRINGITPTEYRQSLYIKQYGMGNIDVH